jgi:two-component sensor histidine kinase
MTFDSIVNLKARKVSKRTTRSISLSEADMILLVDLLDEELRTGKDENEARCRVLVDDLSQVLFEILESREAAQ